MKRKIEIEIEERVNEWMDQHPIMFFLGVFMFCACILVIGVGLCAILGGALAWMMM